MATYEAYVTLGDGSIAISTVEIPLSVQSQTGDVASPMAYLMLVLPPGHELLRQTPQVHIGRNPDRGEVGIGHRPDPCV